MAEVISLLLVTMTLAISNHWVSDTGNETIAKNQLAHTSKRTLSKKSLYECKQEPSSIATKHQKTVYSISKFFYLAPLLLTLVINVYFLNTSANFRKTLKWPP